MALLGEPGLMLLAFLAGRSQQHPPAPSSPTQPSGPTPTPAPSSPAPAPAPLPSWPTPGETTKPPAAMGGWKPASHPTADEVAYARGLLPQWKAGDAWYGKLVAYRAEGTPTRRAITVWHPASGAMPQGGGAVHKGGKRG